MQAYGFYANKKSEHLLASPFKPLYQISSQTDKILTVIPISKPALT